MKRILSFVLIMGGLHAAFGEYMPKAKVTIEVVDDAGQPVADAEIDVLMDGRRSVPGNDRVTDKHGRWVVEAQTRGIVEGRVGNDRYYSTEFRLDLDSYVPEGVTIGRRYPDVTHRVVIRPKAKPVAMYAYELTLNLPVDVDEVGLDLLKADWVAPHGKGKDTDVLVKITGSADSGPFLRYGNLSWQFPRKGDGMVRVRPEDCYPDSEFVMPRLAPENGYISEWGMTGKLVDKKYATEVFPDGPLLAEVPYFFRIRTELDNNGRVVKALYGKIIKRDYGIKWFSAHEKDPAWISLTYYVNPDGTRNMEFDPEKNLFKDIMPPQESHRLPKWP